MVSDSAGIRFNSILKFSRARRRRARTYVYYVRTHLGQCMHHSHNIKYGMICIFNVDCNLHPAGGHVYSCMFDTLAVAHVMLLHECMMKAVVLPMINSLNSDTPLHDSSLVHVTTRVV